MSSVIDIEGVGEIYSQKLHEAGIATTEALLEQGATPHGRKELADKTGISERLILKWVNRADLFRVKGIGEQYSDLLAAAGVETVLELAQRRADHLHQKMVETNEAKKLVRIVPGLEHVTEWVKEAAKLPRVVSY
jgi:predicted flap endonuclease-1-like 5' DNA nuclease